MLQVANSALRPIFLVYRPTQDMDPRSFDQKVNKLQALPQGNCSNSRPRTV